MEQNTQKLPEAAVVIEVNQLDNGTVLTLPKTHIGGNRAPAEMKREYNAPKAPIAEESANYRWAKWGQTDNLPMLIFLKYLEVPFFMQALWRTAEMLFANGPILVDADAYDSDGIIQSPSQSDKKKALEFNRRNRIITKYLIPQFFQFKLFANTFSQIDMSVDKKQVTNIYHLDAWHSRLSKQNVKNNRIEWVKFCGRFSTGEWPTDQEIVNIPLFQWDKPDWFIQEYLKKYTFAWHTALNTPGQIYYATPLHIGNLNNDSWLNISKNVPAILKATRDNAIRLRYLIVVSMRYYELRYKDTWYGQNMTDQKRQDLINAHIKEVEDALTGASNAGKTIWTFAHEINGVKEGLIEIKPIDDKFKTDSWLMDSTVADTQLLASVGLDGSQMPLANAQGGQMRGAGSDKRVGFNIGIETNTATQEAVYECLNWCYRFNGWNVRAISNHSQQLPLSQAPTGTAPGGIKNNSNNGDSANK